MGGLLGRGGGQRVCWPLSNLGGGGGLGPLFLRLCIPISKNIVCQRALQKLDFLLSGAYGSSLFSTSLLIKRSRVRVLLEAEAFQP